jgi:hypothetical protein
MSDHRIAHICPAGAGGVNDYVDVCRSAGRDSDKLSLAFTAEETTVLPPACLLHYSGYGYAKRGAPSWLVNDVRSQRKNIRILGVFFHELYASGPPWTSAFWLSPLQRKIASELAKLSDFWIANRQGSADWLQRQGRNKPHAVLPVFSNVGEKSVYAEMRDSKLVIFGSAELRKQTYQAAGERLFIWADQQGLTVHDIGSPIRDPGVAAFLGRKRVLTYGRMAPEAVSAQLATAAFGLVAYPADFAAKSGVFAAYCAHGVCPILISDPERSGDGLTANEHYLAGVPTSKIGEITRTGVARSAWEWYQPHRVELHLETIRRLSEGASVSS